MLKKILIQNFRSLEAAEVTFAPITVLYGPTASGKSSLLYALLVLRNFVLNPNRQADGFFHLGFMDLGGFEACVFNHEILKTVGISIEYTNGPESASYGLSFSKTGGNIRQSIGKFEMGAIVNLPYGLNQTFPCTFIDGEEEYTINWNGIICSVVPNKPTAETQKKAQEITTRFNEASEILKTIDIAPHRRGFFRSNYTPVSPSPTPTTEEEVASIIINDQHLPGRISTYTDEIFGRDFRTHVIPGTATAYLQSTDKKSRIPVQLVNEGFGVNQVIYILAKMLRVDVRTILIEEPEVHLHPTVIRNFARALSTFVKEERKQVICTTHSEQFLVALLVAVADGLMEPNDIRCYLTTKEMRSTDFKEQEVHKDGRIEGGLASFIEAQVEDLKRFFGDRKRNG
jgi:predicted ATPase